MGGGGGITTVLAAAAGGQWRPLRLSDHEEVQKLHEEWFLVDFTSKFFGTLCSPRWSPNDDADDDGGRSWFEAIRRENYDD